MKNSVIIHQKNKKIKHIRVAHAKILGNLKDKNIKGVLVMINQNHITGVMYRKMSVEKSGVKNGGMNAILIMNLIQIPVILMENIEIYFVISSHMADIYILCSKIFKQFCYIIIFLYIFFFSFFKTHLM